MEKLIFKYILTSDLQERRRLLLDHPVLLSRLVEAELEPLAVRLASDPSEELRHLQENLDLLRRCRESGLSSVFPDAFPAQLQELPLLADKEMVTISAGEVLQGSEHGDPARGEAPVRTVHLDAFSIARYPVTNADYARFILETGYPATERRMEMQVEGTVDDETAAALASLLPNLSRGFRLSAAETHPDHPVVDISWYDAVEYARWAGQRLPTAEEWEKAARGDDGREWSWGSEPDSRRGNTRESEIGTTTEVTRYAAWPSPYGCNDLSGNVMEWTATVRNDGTWSGESYVIKGGGWMFPLEEARVWKRESDGAGDLWNMLGFRCCRSLEQEGGEDSPQRDRALRLLRQTLGIDSEESLLVLPLLELARASLSGQISPEEAQEQLFEALRHPESLSLEDMLQAASRFVRWRVDRAALLGEEVVEAQVIASLLVQSAEQMDVAELSTQARHLQGVTGLAGRDISAAVDVLEACLEDHRQNPGSPEEMVSLRLDLAKAKATRNLSFGTDHIDAPQALQLLQEALPQILDMGWKLAEQQALWQLAVVHRLLGDKRTSFNLAQQSLAHSAALTDRSAEVQSLLHVGEVFLDLNALEYARYCFQTAHRLASAIADMDLVFAARVRLCLLASLNDPPEAARLGALALETAVLGGRSAVYPLLGIVSTQGADPITSWAIIAFLGNLAGAVVQEEIRLLHLIPLAEGAASYAFRAHDVVRRSAEALKAAQPFQSAGEEYFIRALRALAFAAQDSERALRESGLALEAARQSGNPYFRANAHQIRIEVAKELSLWQAALEGLGDLIPEIREKAQPGQLISYLIYGARLNLWAGEVSAALEACDEATIAANEESGNQDGYVSLLRCRILLAIGSRGALLESEAAKILFFAATDRLGTVEHLILQARALLLPPDISLSAVARRLEWARGILADATGGRVAHRLTGELLVAFGELFLRAGDLPQAGRAFEDALARARQMASPDQQIEALIGLIDIGIARGDWTDSARRVDEALAIARPRHLPFELLELLTRAGEVGARGTDLDRASSAFGEALQIYHQIREGIRNNPILRKEWLKKNRRLFEMMVSHVLLPRGRSEEAILLLEQARAAALSDLLWESRQATASGLPVEVAERARQVWREIRQKEIELERMASWVGNELEQYQTRIALRTLRGEWRVLWANAEPQSRRDPYRPLTGEDLNMLLEALGSGTVLVELFATSERVWSFVLTSGSRPIVSELPGLHRERLQTEITNRFTEPYRELSSARRKGENLPAQQQEFQTHLEELLEFLYTEIFSAPARDGRTLLQILTSLQPSHVILLPSDVLATVPLQAAFTRARGELRSLLDEFPAVSVVPSLGLLQHSTGHSAWRKPRLLAVQDPDVTLRSAKIETELVASLFSSPRILAHGDARKGSLLEELSQATVAHFACHGLFNSTSPFDSGLLLADGVLTLAEIYMNAALRRGSLVTLSSCESGLVDLQFADEVLGLPSGFLYTGASGVICSLWEVDDLSTALLMGRFYEIWITGGLGVAEALGRAQVWLRQASQGEILVILQRQVDRLWEQSAINEANQIRGLMASLRRIPSEHPFAHPYYWSVFQAVGGFIERSPLARR